VLGDSSTPVATTDAGQIARLLDDAKSRFAAGEIRESCGLALQASELAREAADTRALADAALVVAAVPDPGAAAAVERMAGLALASVDQDQLALRARLESQLSVALHLREQFEPAQKHAELALALAEQSGDLPALADALHARGLAMAGTAEAGSLLALGDQMLEAAIGCGAAGAELAARVWRVDALIRMGRTEQAGHEIDSIDVLAARSRSRLALWNAHLCRAGLYQAIGRLAEAESEARIARDVLPASQRPHTEPLFIAQLMLIATDLGQEPAEIGAARANAVGTSLIAVAMTGRYDLEMGDDAGAMVAFESVRARIDRVQLDRRGLPTLAAELQLAVAARDIAVVADLRRRLEPYADAMIASSLGAVGPVSYYLSAAELALGNIDAAIGHAQSAIELTAEGGFGPWLARSRAIHAEALRARGGADDMRRAAHSARLADIAAAQLGMVRLKARTAALVERLAARTRLSRRELEIAGLVSDGLSNREISSALGVAERTVETHVQNILTKLDFHSRTEVAAWVVREGIVADGGT